MSVILGLLVLAFAFAAQPQRKRSPRKKVEDKRVYLVHSDNLHYDQYRNGDAQVLHGNVHFRHQGADLFCDSALLGGAEYGTEVRCAENRYLLIRSDDYCARSCGYVKALMRKCTVREEEL